MQDNILKNPFVFAALICVVCSAVLSLCASGFRDIQAKNQEIYQHRNILLAVGIPENPEESLTPEEVEEIFSSRMEKITIDAEGNRIEAVAAPAPGQTGPTTYDLYLYRSDGEVDAYVLPLTGQGLWGPISGYLALTPDFNTIKGVTFATKMETPGLGAEIAAPPFEDQFHGKHIYDSAGKLVSIEVVKGEAAKVAHDRIDHAVDGVSGATITSKGVEEMFRRWLNIYEPYFRSVKAAGKEAD